MRAHPGLRKDGVRGALTEQEGPDRPAASRAQDRAAPANAAQTPAGVCLPLLRQADADPAAATSADGGQPTRFDAGNGDGRVGLRLRHDGAPHQRHGRARPESAEKRPMNAKLRASAGLRR